MVEQAELLEYFDGNTGLLFEVEIFHSTQLGCYFAQVLILTKM